MSIITFKPVFVEETNLDKMYFRLLWELWEKGRKNPITSGSHAGSHRLSFDHVSGFIHNPYERPLAPTMPMGISPPTTDAEIEKYFVDYIMDANLEPNEHYRYSSWIRGDKKNCKIDQVEWIINHFKEHGYGNNHCYLTVGHPESSLNYDIPYKKCPTCSEHYKHDVKVCPVCQEKLEIDESHRRTSPCLRGLDYKIKDGYLLTHVIFRSWDLWGGWPENMGGITLLNEYISTMLGDIVPGPISFSCSDLHTYSHHIKALAIKLNKEDIRDDFV